MIPATSCKVAAAVASTTASAVVAAAAAAAAAASAASDASAAEREVHGGAAIGIQAAWKAETWCQKVAAALGD